MRELSRVSLYTWTRKLLEDTRASGKRKDIRDVALEILTSEAKITDIIGILDYNIDILQGIEESFLVGNAPERQEFRMNDQLQKRILERYEPKRKKNDNREPIEIFNSYNSYKYTFDSQKAPYERFIHLLNYLNDVSNRALKDTKTLDESYSSDEEKNSLIKFGRTHKVFLSHAYDDKLYTFCLFLYLLDKDILAYVDWIFCKELNDGRMIKENLSEKIDKSKQLLFIRSNNSELRVIASGSRNKNKYDIKGWCAWEIGEFYHMHHDRDQFFLKLYNSDETKSNKKESSSDEKRDIKILDDLRPLNRIAGGQLGA